jgi:hypothetical protein
MFCLPNSILSRILSLLPIKEAVATSILSKRWIHVWHYFDNIDFPDIITLNSMQSAIIFNKFMDSVLVSGDAAGSHSINSFCLKIVYGNRNIASILGFPNVTKWIDLVVVQRGLKYLCLRVLARNVDDCDSDDDDDVIGLKPTLPISILSCKTLVSLDLARFCVKGFTFSGFPSLNQLHLYKIVFQQVRDFMLLLAGCPNLEYLRVEDIDFYYQGDSLTIQEFESVTLPKCISAVITQCRSFPLKAVSNLEYLCIQTSMLFTEDRDREVYGVCFNF